MLLGFAGSIADLLFNFYLVSLGYAADTAGLLATVSRTAGVVLGLPIGLLIDRAGARRALLVGVSFYGGERLGAGTLGLWAGAGDRRGGLCALRVGNRGCASRRRKT